MVNIKIQNETYERLKSFIADPFDDTPDAVLSRLMEIAEKAQQRCSTFELAKGEKKILSPAPEGVRVPSHTDEESEVVL